MSLLASARRLAPCGAALAALALARPQEAQGKAEPRHHAAALTPYAAAVPSVPDLSGRWQIDLERSQHDEMQAIMELVGVPAYLLRMGRLTPSTMSVTQTAGGEQVSEVISQLGGLYKTTVELYTDGRAVHAKHPLNGSVVETRTRWELVPREELEPCGRGEAQVVCCVSRGEYVKYGHRQRIARFLDDDGQTFHSVNTLYRADGGPPLTAHRLLRRLE